MTEERRYKNSGTRYTPVPQEERKYRVRRPANPEAVRFGGDWFLPLDVLPDAERVAPETRPDSESVGHRLKCRCHVCRRPGGKVWLRQQRLAARRAARSGSAPEPASAPAESRP